MDVRMELSRVLITELSEQQMIFLREVDGERSFPIMIGINEVLAIDRRLKNQRPPRPMTHELLANVLETLGGKLDRIVINDLMNHTFIATLHITCHGETFEIDSRPSDAIALGVAFGTPIFVAEHVLENVTKGASPEDRVQMLRDRLAMLQRAMAELARKLEDEDFVAQTPESVLDEYRSQLDVMKNEHDAIDSVLKKIE